MGQTRPSQTRHDAWQPQGSTRSVFSEQEQRAEQGASLQELDPVAGQLLPLPSEPEALPASGAWQDSAPPPPEHEPEPARSVPPPPCMVPPVQAQGSGLTHQPTDLPSHS